MTDDIPLTIASLYDVCRPVTKTEFKADLEYNAVYSRFDKPPVHRYINVVADPSETQALFDRSQLDVVRHVLRQKTFIAHIRDARLIPDVLCVITPENQVLAPNNFNDHSPDTIISEYINRSPSMYTIKKTGPNNVVEWEHYLNRSPEEWQTFNVTTPHVLIGNMCGFSYYHFLFDIVPKLWIYDEWPELKQYPMIVGPMGDKFKQALADAVGIPFSQILSIPQGLMANLHFKHLIFPSALSDRVVSKEQIDLIRRKIGGPDFRHAAPGEQRYRVYVSRADRPYHRIDSETEIERILKEEFGFIPVIGGQLTMGEQANLFSKTEMVVGAAAGGLANMVYMPPQSVFLELASREPFGDPSHRDIMAACEIRHIMLVASWNIHRLRRGDMKTNERGPTAMLFDMDRLREAVRVGLSMLE